MRVRLGQWAAAMLLLILVPVVATAGAVTTTQVADTVYRADGTPATGTVVISWAGFTTAGGQTVAGGSTSATISANGTFSVQLAPNASATPMGSYYTAVFHLNDGSVTREYWVVPVSSTSVAVSAIQSSVLPTSVAMQTASKSYVDTAIAAVVAGVPIGGTVPFVNRAGDTLTGPLLLAGDPDEALQAADKRYVDTAVGNVASGLTGKISTAPQATQAVAQPAGTQMQTNRLNGSEYASQYASGHGDNGIANALSSGDCVAGCDLKVEPTYASQESYVGAALPSGLSRGTHVEDLRGGERRDSYMNPVDTLVSGNDAAQVIDVTSTRSAANVFQQTNAQEPSSEALLINHRGLTGGSNLFPLSLGGSFPYFKSSYSALSLNGTYNTMGQHILQPNTMSCYGVGDCLMGSQILTSSGGFRDEADEGAHPFDVQIREDAQVFQGACTLGCSVGSTVVTIGATSGAGTQGEGRFLIDKAPAKVLTTGVLTGGAVGAIGAPGASATFTGTTFPVSVFLATGQLIPAQANAMAPGSVRVAIATTGVTPGFATSTAALPNASGVACVADIVTASNPNNYEMAPYTVVDGTHLQMSFNKLHGSGATLAFGGLCGYGLEQTVDTNGGIRQVFPVLGSSSPTSLYYAAGLVPLVGASGLTSGYLNLSVPVASVRRSGGIATVTTSSSLPDVNGLVLTVSGIADTTYNGSFPVTTTSANSLTYASSGPDGTSAGGRLSLVTGGFALYPMAEVLGVFNQGTASVDGQLTLAPNTVAWSTGDAVEEPHFFEQAVGADIEFVSQMTPRATPQLRAGLEYDGNNGPGLRGWSITNATPASSYFGNGGTHGAPDTAMEVRGVWSRIFEAEAGNDAVFTIHCNSRGCGRWDSGYNLFTLDNSSGTDTVGYQPATSALSFGLRGTTYSFTPQGMTAGTVNATTVNAGTLNGAVSASNVTGTLGAAQLPIFGASGSGHTVGAVPDPGASAGSTRYLREDGSWSVPAGSGGGGTPASGAGLLAGATADFDFRDAGGTTIADSTGSGNAGTLSSGASAPTWTSTGLAFLPQQGVALPAALNGTQSYFVAVSINPISSSMSANQYPVLLSSSNGGSGFNLMYDLSTSSGQFLPGAFAPTLYVNGQHTTEVPNVLSGFHVLGVVLGTGSGSLDHVYIDGTEVGTYTAQGSSAGAQASGNLYVGSSRANPWANSGFDGTVYRLRTYPFPVGAADVKTVSAAIRNEVALRGVATSPQAIQLATPQLHAIGDSITFGYGVSTPWPSLLALTNQPAYAVTNWGVTSMSMQAIVGSDANRVATRCQSSAGPTVAVVFAGTNDFGSGLSAPASQVFSYMLGEVQQLKQAGCRVFVGTMLSRGGTDASGGTSFDADKDAYDALILQQAPTYGADGVVDFAANPQLGADGAYAGSSFQNDQTHPTQAGQALLAAAASNALNYAFGYSPLNPHSVTTVPYSMSAGDGAISLSGVTSGGRITLPDCTGQSGAVYRINNPQSTYAVTIGPLNVNQLINGLAFGTAVTVPPNGTLTIRDVPNPKTVSGCHWEM